MYRLAKIIFIVGLLGNFLIASGIIQAVKVPGNVSNAGPTSKAWISTGYQTIILYPQTTMKSSETNTTYSPKMVRVKAIYDGDNISFLLKWRDVNKNVQDGYHLDVYGDGYAMQFPIKFNDATKLPYIGMGSKKRAVVIEVKKATGTIYEPNIDVDIFGEADNTISIINKITEEDVPEYQKVFVSEGFESMTQIKNNSVVGKMQMLYKNGFWRGTLSLPLKSSYLDIDKGSFPISFAVWDGDKNETGESKLISSWLGVKLVAKDGGEKLINILTSSAKGDVRSGKKIVLDNCAACHRYANTNMAPNFMAPNLSEIGGYSTKEYLVESIVNPSAVVVSKYKTNAERSFPWYNLNNNGNRVSTMPSYDWLDQKSLDDVVAFLQTLKSKIK